MKHSFENIPRAGKSYQIKSRITGPHDHRKIVPKKGNLFNGIKKNLNTNIASDKEDYTNLHNFQ